MSFASDVKKELCKHYSDNPDVQRAECYGLLLFAKKFSYRQISLSTENSNVANRFMDLISKNMNSIVEKKSTLFSKNSESSLITLIIPQQSDCNRIFEGFGHTDNEINLRINRANIEDDECIKAFLCGAFLCCGTVTDPNIDYHIEFVMPYRNLCSDLCKLISEVPELSITPKIIVRKGSFVAYIKGNNKVVDFLTYIGAPIKAMDIIETKIIKEIRNELNRKTNSEVANMQRTATAAAKQVRAIEKIKTKMGFSSLPDELRELCNLRIENPELSLKELGEKLRPKISRSGVNHRMQRIIEISESLK
ncbi:MAG: DNA-binding protein WhiA [Bacillota bacterium]|nr:DNA-binding protein WhiA [Bacillota bacterium]